MLLTTFDLVSAREVVDKILDASTKQGKFDFNQDFRIALFEKFILDDNDADGKGYEEELLSYIRSESKKRKERCEFLSEKAKDKKGLLTSNELREMRRMWGEDWRVIVKVVDRRTPELKALWAKLEKEQPLPKTKQERLEIEVKKLRSQEKLRKERRKGFFALAMVLAIPLSYFLFSGMLAVSDGYCASMPTKKERISCIPVQD